VGYLEGEFILNRGISNDFKEVFKREKVVSFNRELMKFIEGSHNQLSNYKGESVRDVEMYLQKSVFKSRCAGLVVVSKSFLVYL